MLKVSSKIHKCSLDECERSCLFSFCFSLFSHRGIHLIYGCIQPIGTKWLHTFLHCPFLLCTTVNIQWNEDPPANVMLGYWLYIIIWFDRFDEFSTSAIFVRLSTLGFYEFDQRNFHVCSSNRLILLNHEWTGDFGLSVNWNRVERNYRKFDSFGRNQVKPILNSCNPCNS